MNGYDAWLTNAPSMVVDEPKHTATRCANCNLFIRRDGWECEPDDDEGRPVLMWFVTCKNCGWVTWE